MIEIKNCSIQVILDLEKEHDLVSIHHDEIERHMPPFHLDESWYIRQEREGRLITTCVYDGEFLIGYSVDIVAPNPHYGGKPFAVNDALYLSPQYRHLGLKEKLLAVVEKRLIAREIRYSTITLKADNKCEKSMRALGYTLSEVVWHKAIKR